MEDELCKRIDQFIDFYFNGDYDPDNIANTNSFLETAISLLKEIREYISN